MAVSSTTKAASLVPAYLGCVLEGDRFGASELLVQAVKAGKLSVQQCYEKVLGPAQRELWKLWRAGDISIADEHMASGTTHLVMSRLYPLMPRAKAGAGGGGRTAVIASVEGNTHDIGARMVADYLEMAGWRTIFLGADVPARDIAAAARTFSADLVAVSASLPGQVKAVRATIAAVRSRPAAHLAPVMVGGPAFAGDAGLWKRVGADGFAGSAGQAVETAERLVGAKNTSRRRAG